MRIRGWITTMLLFISGFAMAQNPTLKFKIAGVKDTTVHLAYYFGNKLYYADTSKADKNGMVVFGGKKKKYDAGMYAVVVPGNKFFVLVLNNENIFMESDTADFENTMVVKTSNENKLFYDYIQFLNKKKLEADPIREKLKALPDQKGKDAEKLKDELNKIGIIKKNLS